MPKDKPIGLERRDFKFRLDSVDKARPGSFSGYASVFNELNESYNEIIDPGAFTQTLKHCNGEGHAIYDFHWGPWIGVGMRTQEDNHGLFVNGQLAIQKNVAAQGIHELMLLVAETKASTGLSIGFNSIKREEKDGICHQKEIALYEYSICPPRYQSAPGALVGDVRSREQQAMRDFIVEQLTILGVKTPELEAYINTQGSTSKPEAQDWHSIAETLETTVQKLRRR